MKKLFIVALLCILSLTFLSPKEVQGSQYWQVFDKAALEALVPNLYNGDGNSHLSFPMPNIATNKFATEAKYIMYVPDTGGVIDVFDTIVLGLVSSTSSTTLTETLEILPIPFSTNWYSVEIEYIMPPTYDLTQFIFLLDETKPVAGIYTLLTENVYIAEYTDGLAALNTLGYDLFVDPAVARDYITTTTPTFHYNTTVFNATLYFATTSTRQFDDWVIINRIDPRTFQRTEVARFLVPAALTNVFTFSFNFSNVLSADDTIQGDFPYEVMFGQTILHRGWVASAPHASKHEIAVNNVANRSSINAHSSTNVDIVQRGDYFLFHYELPVSGDYTVVFVNESTSEIVFSLEKSEILTYQGGATATHRNAFIPIVTYTGSRVSTQLFNYNKALTTFIESDFPFARLTGRTQNMFNNLNYGVYTYYLLDDTDAIEVSSPSVFLITNSIDEYTLQAPRGVVAENGRVRFLLNRSTPAVYDFYDTFSMYDDYQDETYTFSSLFTTMQTLGWTATDEGGDVTLTMTSDADMFFGDGGDTFPIVFESQYTVGEVDRLRSGIDQALILTGLDNTAGNVLLFFFFIAIVNILLLLARFTGIALIIPNIVLLAIFTYIGLLPLWFIVPIFGIITIGGLSVMKGGF